VIGIFAALGRELKPIKACLPDLDEFQESGVRFTIGHLNQLTIVLIQTGIGWNRALSAAQIAAARFPLRFYISTGFAGALQDSIQVGDLVIGQKVLSLLPIYPATNASERGRLHPALPVEGATQAPITDQKVFICDAAFTQSAGMAAKTFPGTVFFGSLATVGQIVGRVEEKKAIARKSDAIALDMETAAVADVAEQRRLPFIAVRAVSDILEEELGLDGNQLLTDQGKFRWLRGIRYLMSHPTALNHLNRLRRQSNLAARSLGFFFREFLPSLSLN